MLKMGIVNTRCVNWKVKGLIEGTPFHQPVTLTKSVKPSRDTSRASSATQSRLGLKARRQTDLQDPWFFGSLGEMRRTKKSASWMIQQCWCPCTLTMAAALCPATGWCLIGRIWKAGSYTVFESCDTAIAVAASECNYLERGSHMCRWRHQPVQLADGALQQRRHL